MAHTETSTYVRTSRVAHLVNPADPSRTICRRLIAKFEQRPLNDGTGYGIERFTEPFSTPRCTRCETAR